MESSDVVLRDKIRTQPPSHRTKIRQQVWSCTNCNLHKFCARPVPFTGPLHPDFIVIGEAPGAVEDKKNQPFVGPAGKLFRALLWEAGFDADRMAYMNSVSCWPKDARGDAHTPTIQEQAACRQNLLDQLELFPTPYVLLVGAVALGAFRDDLQIMRNHGRLYIWGQRRIVMPMIHPAAALRARGLKPLIKEDLAKWKVVVGQKHRLEVLGLNCSVCKEPLWKYDEDGVPYCEFHYALCSGHAARTKKTWEKRMKDATVEQLVLVDVPQEPKRRAQKTSLS